MKRFLAYMAACFMVLACTSNLESKFSGGMDSSLEGKPVTITFSVPATRLASMTNILRSEKTVSGGLWFHPEYQIYS